MKLRLQKVPKKGRAGPGKDLGEVDVPAGATVEDLKRAFEKLHPWAHPSRQEWRLPPREGEARGRAIKEGPLGDFGLRAGALVILKDLGPQVGYSTVFFWEYLSPLLAYAAIFFLKGPVYGKEFESSETQKLALYYFTFHFAKRILETFLVHRFSHATMPVFNLYRNCGYYGGFAALISYFLNHPLYTSPPEARVKAGLAAALACQAGNLYCHIILRNLRPPGEKAYKIPRGFLFNVVTCANYTTEIYGWLCFNVATQTTWGVLFMLAGAYQMAQWAVAKHKRLRKLFDGKEGREMYPRRWIMLPPFF